MGLMKIKYVLDLFIKIFKVKNKHFLSPDMHTYVFVSGGEKCLPFGNFGALRFLETRVLRFALLPYYRRYKVG